MKYEFNMMQALAVLGKADVERQLYEDSVENLTERLEEMITERDQALSTCAENEVQIRELKSQVISLEKRIAAKTARQRRK